MTQIHQGICIWIQSSQGNPFVRGVKHYRGSQI